MKLADKISEHTFNTQDMILSVSDYLENNDYSTTDLHELQIDFKDAIVVIFFLVENNIYDCEISIQKTECIDSDNIEFWLTDEEISEINGIYNN